MCSKNLQIHKFREKETNQSTVMFLKVIKQSEPMKIKIIQKLRYGNIKNAVRQLYFPCGNISCRNTTLNYLFRMINWMDIVFVKTNLMPQAVERYGQRCV